ncbi:hypothetical protein [Azospirillum argentinense]|uniref:Uncharacterized protein n=1 Tax=Azospirillum brasilense TaxID=192 RepID=A0A4D8QG09_AZOBR|nr:hypothetical protein [Azospirillum argentinense]QCO04872.1 hypothetical protein D3867_23735 [Azospirillum argentinense]
MSRPNITDPADVLSILTADPAERIIRTHVPGGSEWHLERDRREVAGEVVALLRQGGPLLERFPGRLVPVADGLFPEPHLAQSFIWRPDRASLQ